MTRARPSPAPRAPAWRLAIGVPLGLLITGAAAATLPDLALINESPSLPRGLYVRRFDAAPAVGAIVALPQPARARPYLAGLGMPARTRLIKRVVAGGGDRVCWRNNRLEVAGRTIRAHAADRRGRPLPQWRGCRRLTPGEWFLLGDTPDSFDSRYFGPAPDAALEGVFQRILTW